MKKLINTPETVLDQSLAGFGRAHGDLVSVFFSPRYLTRTKKKEGKVAIISGGGSGHEPLHAGFVGVGMLDAACPGEVFTSPTPDQMLAAAEAVDAGAGVLFLIKNYAGDIMNFEMAMEMFEGESASIIVNDDVAVESSTHSQGRRGVAGAIAVEKIIGAAAEKGYDLAAVKALGDRVNSSAATIGVALTSCTVPAAGKPTFEIGDTEIEFGVGVHGEPGRRREVLRPVDEIVTEIMGVIKEEISPSGDVIVIVNGFGGTPLMELYLVFDRVAQLCDDEGLTIARSLVGNYFTSLEMQGCSITIVNADDEMLSLWDAPARTAAINWG
ncbi:MAG: dihydroxyacetone kinase subunit DhaK [Pseudomonadota bacterium]